MAIERAVTIEMQVHINWLVSTKATRNKVLQVVSAGIDNGRIS